MIIFISKCKHVNLSDFGSFDISVRKNLPKKNRGVVEKNICENFKENTNK